MRSQLAESSQAISGSISFDIYAVLGESLFTKGTMSCLAVALYEMQGFSSDNASN